MKAYKYKMYSKAKSGLIDNQIDRFGILYNHCIALYRRYYKLFKKNPSKFAVMTHMAKMKHRERWERIFKGFRCTSGSATCRQNRQVVSSVLP